MFRSFIRIPLGLTHRERPFRNLDHRATLVPYNDFVHGEVLLDNFRGDPVLGLDRTKKFPLLFGFVRLVDHGHDHQNERAEHEDDAPDEHTSIFHDPPFYNNETRIGSPSRGLDPPGLFTGS